MNGEKLQYFLAHPDVHAGDTLTCVKVGRSKVSQKCWSVGTNYTVKLDRHGKKIVTSDTGAERTGSHHVFFVHNVHLNAMGRPRFVIPPTVTPVKRTPAMITSKDVRDSEGADAFIHLPEGEYLICTHSTCDWWTVGASYLLSYGHHGVLYIRDNDGDPHELSDIPDTDAMWIHERNSTEYFASTDEPQYGEAEMFGNRIVRDRGFVSDVPDPDVDLMKSIRDASEGRK